MWHRYCSGPGFPLCMPLPPACLPALIVTQTVCECVEGTQGRRARTLVLGRPRWSPGQLLAPSSCAACRAGPVDTVPCSLPTACCVLLLPPPPAAPRLVEVIIAGFISPAGRAATKDLLREAAASLHR